MTDINTLTDAEVIAKIKASEQREFEVKEARWHDEQKAMNASICQGCGRRWLWGQAVMNRAKPPVFIREAGGYYHLVCWDAKKAKR